LNIHVVRDERNVQIIKDAVAAADDDDDDDDDNDDDARGNAVYIMDQYRNSLPILTISVMHRHILSISIRKIVDKY